MALIGKIRNHSWIIFVFIGLALVGFLLMDSINSNPGAIGSNKRPEFATVNGEPIAPQEYELAYQKALNRYLVENNLVIPFYYTQEYKLDRATEFNLREQAWNNLVNEQLIQSELERIGMKMTDQEFTNLIYGPNPHRFIQVLYSNLSPTGAYDPQNPDLLKNYVNYIQAPENQQDPQIAQAYLDFKVREAAARQDYLYNKYASLVQKSTYAPSWIAKEEHVDKNKKVSFSFVELPYILIPDDSVQATEAELKAYLNKHKNKFRQDESRGIEYVSFEVVPTSRDTARVLERLLKNWEGLKKTDNDSAYIQAYTDDPNRFNRIYSNKKELYNQLVDSATVDSIFKREPGMYYGPYYEGGAYKIAKVLDKRVMPDSAKVRHILAAFGEDGDTTAAWNKIDSIRQLLDEGRDFAELASELSDDPGSQPQGGDLGWHRPNNQFVKPFSHYIFREGKEGETGFVKTRFGYHLIQIEEITQRLPFVNVVYLTHNVIPSADTEDSVDQIAATFFEKYTANIDSFNAGVIEEDLNKKISPPFRKNQFSIVGLPESREIIEWAYYGEKGDFRYFPLSNQYVVAVITDVKEEGYAELEDVRTQVETEVLKEKKAEILKERARKAMEGSTTLNDIAAKLNTSVKNSENATYYANYAPGIGAEPRVIGHVFTMEANDISEPLQGLRGVFIVQPTNIQDAAELEDYSTQVAQLNRVQKSKYTIDNLLEILRDKSDIEDNRYLY